MPDYKATVYFDVVRSDGQIDRCKRIMELVSRDREEFKLNAEHTIINNYHPQASNFEFGPISDMNRSKR